MAARHGFTKDLTPKERREMFAYNRRMKVGVAVRRSKSFVKDHAPLIAVGVIAALMLYFKKDLKETVGVDRGRLTP
jgi:hypothetical protein